MSNRPNVLLIVLDCVRYDHVCGKRSSTPNLERMAEGGTLFENAFAAAPWTPPSHASLFTGVYPSRHGVDVNENLNLGAGPRTLAEELRDHGYRTFAVLPDVHLSRVRDFDRGFEETAELWDIPYYRPDLDWWSSMAWNFAFGRDKKARYTNRVLHRWVRRSSEPFFAFVNFKTAHNSYEPPRRFRRRFERLADGIDHTKVRRYSAREGYAYIAGQLDMSEAELELIRSWYAGAVAYLDWRLGELFGWLADDGVLDDTIVVVTADHGENLGEHHLAYHMFSLHDTLIHVPLLMRGPGIPAGRRVSTLASLTDVAPTILDLLGLGRNGAAEGASLVPFDGRRLHDHVFAEFGRPKYMLQRLARAFPGHDFSPFDRGLRCVRTSTHKLIAGSDGSEQLFDLESDPGELSDVIDRFPAVAADLHTRLRNWGGFAEPSPEGVVPTKEEDDERVTASLRELGYF